MSARSLAVMGALVVGAALRLSQAPFDPGTNRDLTMILPSHAVQAQQQDSTFLERLAEALKNATTARDSARIQIPRRTLILMQDSAQAIGLLECPMPVVTDSSSLSMPTARSRPIDENMPVIRSGCWNPLFVGEKPDSQP